MSLSSDLISQFVKATKDNEKPKSETTVYGTIVYDGKPYVKLDGSELLTPVTTTADVEDGERVTVLIKDHTATVTGNVSSPAARTDAVKDLGKQITEFETVIADKVSTKDFDAQTGRIDQLVADNVIIRGELTAVKADVGELEADNVTINEKLTANEGEITKLKAEKIDVEIADAKYATIENLDATNADVYNLETTYLQFEEATGNRLNAFEANLTNLDSRFATIDFANIGEAAIEKLFTESGIIDNLVMSEGHVTGELIGVEISGDLIKGNTIQADRLIVKGEDGLYHRLNIEGGVTTTETVSEEELQNGLHGNVIIAKSVTADKVNVTDLVAFDATIGGFQITDEAIHSEGKASADNGNRGIYLDKYGQFSIGDDDNYVRYFRDVDNAYKLMIAAESINTQIKKATEALEQTIYEVNKHFSFDENGLTIKAGENAMSIRVDNDIVIFEKNGVQFGWWDGIDFHTGNIMIEVQERAQFGNFAYVPRSDGSLSFLKVEHKTGFYAIVSGGIMSIYGAYPTFEGNTMVIGSDITAELNGTTLILNEGGN
jgi:hypothetical protein